MEAAARVAEILAPYRDDAQLLSIGVSGDPRQMEIPQLELTTHNGTVHFWGSPPGLEQPGELTVQMKLRKLLAVDSTDSVDLRMASPMSGLKR